MFNETRFQSRCKALLLEDATLGFSVVDEEASFPTGAEVDAGREYCICSLSRGGVVRLLVRVKYGAGTGPEGAGKSL